MPRQRCSSVPSAVVLAVALLAGACAAPSPTVTQPPPTPSPSPSPTPVPSAAIVCLPERMTPMPVGSSPAASPIPIESCPDAIAVVRAVVVPLRLPIARIYLVGGRFQCGYLWPGIGSPPICFDGFYLPGTAMHGWVAFFGSDRVAAVALTLAPPIASQGTLAPSPPWQAHLLAFVVPPAGWAMP